MPRFGGLFQDQMFERENNALELANQSQCYIGYKHKPFNNAVYCISQIVYMLCLVYSENYITCIPLVMKLSILSTRILDILRYSQSQLMRSLVLKVQCSVQTDVSPM